MPNWGCAHFEIYSLRKRRNSEPSLTGMALNTSRLRKAIAAAIAIKAATALLQGRRKTGILLLGATALAYQSTLASLLLVIGLRLNQRRQ